MQKFANPTRFLKLARVMLPICAVSATVLLVAGLYIGLVVAPPDYQQGDAARMMFVHVPSAWMASMIYGFMALSSAVALIWRHPLADMGAKAAAPIGATFTFLALVTGSIWGKPMWGSWWVGSDPRVMSVVILLFLYLGYIAIWQMIEEPQLAARVAAILALVGVVMLPVIRFSVDWWNSIHQTASVVRAGGPSMPSSYLWALILMALAFSFYFGAVQLIRMRAEILRRRVRVMRLALAGD